MVGFPPLRSFKDMSLQAIEYGLCKVKDVGEEIVLIAIK
jgi:hypothetical protein